MKKRINFYLLVVLAVIFITPTDLKAQCPPPNDMVPHGYYYGSTVGDVDYFACPMTYTGNNGVLAYITVNGNQHCVYGTGPNRIIYWPKGTPMTWSVGNLQAGDKFHLCEVLDFSQSGPENYSGQGPQAPTFNPQTVGMYKLSYTMEIKRRKLVWIGHDDCPEDEDYTHRVVLFIYVCVIDIPKPTISIGANCGDDILTRPANTNEITYFWQGTSCGTSENDGASTYKVTTNGRYYLRGKHNSTQMWGACAYIDVTLKPPLVAPPIPVVNGELCGATLSMPSAAPPGVNYYWQGSSCGTSDYLNASNPYTVAVSGVSYYVRAFDGTCWSPCTSVIPIIYNIPPAVSANFYKCSCDAGTITLTATPNISSTTCKWYDASNATIGTGTSINVNPLVNTIYYVTSYNATNGCESIKIPVEVKIKSCEKCLDAFKPIEGKKYILSAWVKEDDVFKNATTYRNPYIALYFNGANSSEKFKGSNEIIEGWQKIEKEFIVPTGTDGIKIELGNEGWDKVDVYFDDIRIFPFDGNMVSYVYDPVTLKLVAELDANNYTTYYIYDDEGKLSKVKKETVKGIKTIKEGRTNNVIK